MTVGREVVIALLVGVLQGVFEWLPISSEGNVAALLTLVGSSPGTAIQYSLFLHVGTAIAATVYYRDVLGDVMAEIPTWRPAHAFSPSMARLSFLGVATVVSGVVALVAYSALERIVSSIAGGMFVALIGVLLVGTGVFQLRADETAAIHDRKGSEEAQKRPPSAADAVLVGFLQGLAILPGVSRSGTTVGALLLRGYSGPTSFQLSFVLSIPASLGAGLLVLLDGGRAALGGVIPAVVALGSSAIVGYLAIGILMRVVERVSFGAVCIGLGLLAFGGGILVL